MVSLVDVVGLAVIVAVNAFVAAVLTRYLRLQLTTLWGIVLFVGTVVPVALGAILLLLSGPLGLGPDVGSPGAALVVGVVTPFAIGVAIDLFWMPSPAAVNVELDRR